MRASLKLLLAVSVATACGGLGYGLISLLKLPNRVAINSCEFSPDSQMLAGLGFEDYYGIQWNPGGPNPKSTTLWVYYAAVKDISQVRKVRIDSRDGFGITSASQMRWSPDGRRIAVACLGRLWCVDVETGRKRQCSPDSDLITSMAWRGSGDLVYTSFPRNAAPEAHACDVYVQPVEASPDARTRLATVQRWRDGKGEWIPGNEPGKRDVWSPDGRYLLYTDGPQQSGAIRLLDTQSADTEGDPSMVVLADLPESSALRRMWVMVGSLSDHVSWKMDGTEAVVLLDRGHVHFIHIRAESGQVLDLSERFAPLAGKEHSALEPLWTADGKYLPYTSSTDWLLIRPDPWEVVKVPGFTSTGTSMDRMRNVPHGLWVRTGLRIRDEQGKPVLNLTDYGQVISPDGKWIGGQGGAGGLVIIPTRIQPGPQD